MTISSGGIQPCPLHEDYLVAPESLLEVLVLPNLTSSHQEAIRESEIKSHNSQQKFQDSLQLINPWTVILFKGMPCTGSLDLGFSWSPLIKKVKWIYHRYEKDGISWLSQADQSPSPGEGVANPTANFWQQIQGLVRNGRGRGILSFLNISSLQRLQ